MQARARERLRRSRPACESPHVVPACLLCLPAAAALMPAATCLLLPCLLSPALLLLPPVAAPCACARETPHFVSCIINFYIIYNIFFNR